MLSLVVLGQEVFDEKKNEFLLLGGYNLELEHSLVSLSKWESKHHKPFLTEELKTPEEQYDYVKFMAVHPNVPEYVFESLEEHHLRAIHTYMNDPMTATWFNEPKTPAPSTKVITNELIYYWMAGLGLPVEMQYWHLNRLFVQLKVAHLESQPPKKRSRSEQLAEMRRVNEKRRAEMEAKLREE